jgi:hypothetical protein
MNDDGSVPNLMLMLLGDEDKVEILMEQGHLFLFIIDLGIIVH